MYFTHFYLPPRKSRKKKTEKVNYNQNNVKPGFLQAQNNINAIGKSSKKLKYT